MNVSRGQPKVGCRLTPLENLSRFEVGSFFMLRTAIVERCHDLTPYIGPLTATSTVAAKDGRPEILYHSTGPRFRFPDRAWGTNKNLLRMYDAEQTIQIGTGKLPALLLNLPPRPD